MISPPITTSRRRRRLAALGVALTALLVGGLVAPAASAAPAGALIVPDSDPAAGAVIVSSAQNAAYNLIDGVTTDPRWQSTGGAADPTPWIRYDLGEAYSVDQVQAFWEGAYATDYRIVGWDGAAWQPLSHQKPANLAAAREPIVDLARTDQKFRYVALAVETRFNADWGVALFELQFFGTDGEARDELAPTTPPTDYAGKPFVPDDASNLALTGTATASSSNGAAFGASNAIDGNLTTRWQAAQADVRESITIDLGGTATIDAITLDPEASGGRDVTIRTSVRGFGDWTQFADVTGAGIAHTIVMPENGPVTARFVQLTVNTRTLAYGASYFEIGVWGDADTFVPAPPAPTTPEGAVGTLLSYGKPATARDVEGDLVATNVTDGDLSTRWSANPATTWRDRANWDGRSWLLIDLGADPESIDQVSLRWNPAHASAYGLYVADGDVPPSTADTSAWTQIHGTGAGRGSREVINLPADTETGRWLLIDMTKEGPAGDGNFYAYSLWEVRVFGTPGAGFPINPTPPNPNADAKNPDFSNLVTVWEDDFSGTAGTLPDPTKWTLDPAPAGQNNAELQSYTESTENIALDGDGNLVVSAIKNADGSYTSGRLNTSRTVHAQYGRYEARVQVPQGKGLWPAFWMMGEDFLTGTPWPVNGEIDIMEVIGHEPDVLHNTIHGPDYWGGGGVGGHFDAGVNLSDDFHTYGVDWDRNGLRFWLDEPTNITREITVDEIEAGRGSRWVYDQPFFMILNLAVGGEWPGDPNAETEFPAKMIVDYVRVSQSPDSGQLLTSGFPADPRATTTTVTVPDTSAFGQPVDATITVTAAGSTPSGEVTVVVGDETHELRLKQGAATLRLPALAVGSHDITATFQDPKAALKTSSGAATIAITQAKAEAVIDLGPATVVKTEPVVGVIRLRLGGSAFPTGDVTVTLEDGVTGTVALTEEDYGVAVLRLPPRTTEGDVTATIVYAGDDNVAGFTTTATHSTRSATTPGGPGTGGENPGTGGENPGTGGENPGTGGENPGTGTPTPGTTPTEGTGTPAPGTTPTEGTASTPSIALLSNGRTVDTIARGQTLSILVSDLAPGATVTTEIHSTPFRVGSATADSSGYAAFAWTVPVDFEVGAHTVVVTTPTGDLRVPITVVATPDEVPLAATGGEIAPWVLAGAFALLLAGLVVVAVNRRRRTQDS